MNRAFLHAMGICHRNATVALAALGLSVSTLAGIPEPDTVFFGSIALDGRFIGANDTDVTVELRAMRDGPPLRTYRMGDSPAAGNLYVLRATIEHAPPLLADNAVPLGSTVHLVVLDGSGERDARTHAITSRGRFVRIDFGDVDSDGDGMSDSFENLYFGSSTGGDPSDDPDQDGRPNLREFLQGTNPLVADGLHPADIQPADSSISIAEVTAYTLAWQLGEEWSIEPAVIPVDYVTRAGALWVGGEKYTFHNDPPTNAPMWWIPAPAPALASPQETPSDSLFQTAGLHASPTIPTSAATRTAPEHYSSTGSVLIRIVVTPDEETLSFAVEESAPAGWLVRNISGGGRLDRVNHKIKWGPFYDGEAREFTYEATPLPGTAEHAVLSGVASFNGVSLAIRGASQLLPPGAEIAPRIVAQSSTADQFSFHVDGSPGRHYVIEASADLVRWDRIGSATADSLGGVVFKTARASSGQQFFRVRLEGD